MKSQVLIQRPSLDGLSQAGPCKDTMRKGGGAQASKAKLQPRKMKPKQPVGSCGLPSVPGATGTVLGPHRTPTRSQPHLQIFRSQILPDPLPSGVPDLSVLPFPDRSLLRGGDKNFPVWH